MDVFSNLEGNISRKKRFVKAVYEVRYTFNCFSDQDEKKFKKPLFLGLKKALNLNSRLKANYRLYFRFGVYPVLLEQLK